MEQYNLLGVLLGGKWLPYSKIRRRFSYLGTLPVNIYDRNLYSVMNYGALFKVISQIIRPVPPSLFFIQKEDLLSGALSLVVDLVVN